MQSDDLNRPLTGRTPAPGEAALGAGAPWGKLAVGGLGLLGALLAGFVWMTDDGAGGQPFAVARIEPLRTPVAATAAPPAAPAPLARENGVTTVRPSGEGREENGVRVVRRGGSGANPIIINVQDALDLSLAPAPDQRLVERTRHGLAPRIGADGARPMEVYARPQMTSGAVRANAPRIALVVGGMGLNPELTRAAVESLPPAVTLGFAPYGPDLAAQAAHAREQGHEILLQAPMEGFGGAAEDPGPNVLRASDPANVTLDKLMWHMTRFPGYVGVAGFLGGKFTADSRAFAPVLSEVSNRGLFYFDDGASTRSLAATLASRAAVPLARATIVIDARPDAIDDALLRLEAAARAEGSAIGAASGLPLVVEKVARFAKALEQRGLALTPLSALVAVPSPASARADR